jgi:signal transduction histidine kinase
MYIYYIYATRIKDKVVMSHSTLYESNVRLNKNRQKLDKLNMAIKQDLVIQEKLNEYILQRKELLEKALDTMPDAWAIMERDLSISYYNKKYEAEFVDESGKDKVFLDVIRESKKVFDKLGAKISISDKKVDIYDKKFLLNVNHDKHHDNYLISLNDITAESIMDKKLKEINEDYEKIVMNIPCPIAIRTTGEDDEKNVLMQVNDSFIKSFGISEEELLKYTIKEYIDKFELRIFDSNKFDVVDIHDIEARKFIEDSKEKRGIIDYSIVDSYGNRRIEEVRLADYYIENNIFELLTFKDISEEIDILSEINNRSITYEKILDAIPEAIFLENISTSRVIYTNKAFVDLFGIEDDTSGEVTQKYRNILVKKYINNLKIGNQGKYINIVNEKNTIKEVELVSRKIYFGQRECKVRIIRDLSVQRKSEKMQKSLFKQRAYDQMKMEFYANISHELKTPLNNIYSSSQLIEKLFEGGKIKESTDVLDNHLRITKQNMFRLMKLIDNIINISQIKSEIYMVNIEKFNVVEAVEDIVASTDAYYKSNNIDLVFDTNEEVIMVELDPESIERIVLNLLSNSIKFTQPGGKITVGVYKNGKNVELMVKDTGVGIKGEKLKEIFGRFNQIEDSGVSNEFGSGIGLFLTKSLVDAQKGKIDIESEINEGTEITITFSVMDSE